MDSGIFIPLAAMAAVVLIVAIISLTKIRDLEVRAYQTLHFEELEHARKMQELEAQLRRVTEARSRGAGRSELRTG